MNNNLALNVNYNLKVISCASCSIPMFIPATDIDKLKDNHKNFYCIKGHTNYFPQESDNERLEKQIKVEQDINDFLRKQNEQERNRTRAQKGAKTKLKNKIAKGICPCCNKPFRQLKAHMKNKHPEFILDKDN